MPISLVLDIIISGLLVLTIAYAMRLNQRLSQLRSDKKELMQLAKTFADATVRAEEGIQKLKVSSESLQVEINKAEALKDDLAYLVDRGGRTADEMVDNVRTPSGSDAGGEREPKGRANTAQAQLIEDAIRVAGSKSQMGGKRPTDARDARDSRTPDAGSSRRITGRLGALAPDRNPERTQERTQERNQERTPERFPARPQQRPQERFQGQGVDAPAQVPSRGFGAMNDEDSIGDTEAARELLKALSAVK